MTEFILTVIDHKAQWFARLSQPVQLTQGLSKLQYIYTNMPQMPQKYTQ